MVREAVASTRGGLEEGGGLHSSQHIGSQLGKMVVDRFKWEGKAMASPLLAN